MRVHLGTYGKPDVTAAPESQTHVGKRACTIQIQPSSFLAPETNIKISFLKTYSAFGDVGLIFWHKLMILLQTSDVKTQTQVFEAISDLSSMH